MNIGGQYSEYYFDDYGYDLEPEEIYDEYQEGAEESLRHFFEQQSENVFYSRQVEVMFEDDYFHWVSNRAIRNLIEEGTIKAETRTLRHGAQIHLLWHRKFRYYKRAADKVLDLVNRYSDQTVTISIGQNGENLIALGFARKGFLFRGEHTNEYGGIVWKETGHNLDFIFEKDDIAYGIEVKNTLSYIPKLELEAKIKMCKFLGIKPVFAVRMLPKNWIKKIIDNGGFALILKYQLYPLALRELAKEIKAVFNLPVDSPKALADGTIQRFDKWHQKNVNSKSKSQRL